VYVRKGDGVAAKGHLLNFHQDISELAQTLPRLAKEVKTIIVRKQGDKQGDQVGPVKDLRVRRDIIEEWLLFLKRTSPPYKHIDISQENLGTLPEDGEIELNVQYESEEVIKIYLLKFFRIILLSGTVDLVKFL
jgi:hypothetical protein